MSIVLKNQPFNSVWISADSQEELGNTFIRFQEYYESPNKDFKNKIFTLGQVRSWYSAKYGGDTYHNDWTGFNFPSSVLLPFRQGLFDPLTSEEKELLKILKYRHDSFYIIGAQNVEVLRHELSHALYSHSIKYKIAINQLCHKHKKELKKIEQYILDKGYDKSVVNDEIQAYVTDNDDDFIKKHTPSFIIDQINQLYSYHSKQN
jgi:hypothetical protein